MASTSRESTYRARPTKGDSLFSQNADSSRQMRERRNSFPGSAATAAAVVVSVSTPPIVVSAVPIPIESTGAPKDGGMSMSPSRRRSVDSKSELPSLSALLATLDDAPDEPSNYADSPSDSDPAYASAGGGPSSLTAARLANLRSASRTSARVSRGHRKQHSITSESSFRSTHSISSQSSFCSVGTADSRSLISAASRRSATSVASAVDIFRQLIAKDGLATLKPSLFIPSSEIHIDEDPMASAVGEGGQGSIFVGWLHNQPVAVKVSCEENVLYELMLVDRLRHPNIVRALGYSAVPPSDDPDAIIDHDDPSDSSWIFLSMYEYCPHRDLASFLRCNPPRRRDVPFMRNVFDGILAGLDHIHRYQMVHTDIKPDNCLLDAEMNVKIADFGMCQPVSQTMIAQGTPSYLAPELVSDWFSPEQPHAFSAKVDIFSFGVLMVHCLTGRYPYGRITMRLQSGLPFTQDELQKLFVPSEKRIKQIATIDGVFATMVTACLAYAPEKRPSAGELRAMLRLPHRQRQVDVAASQQQSLIPTHS